MEQDARIVKERILMAAQHEKASIAAHDLKEFIEKHGWTQAAVAMKLGVSNAVISQFLKGKYKGNINELVNKIGHLLDSLERRERRVKNTVFVKTAVAKKIHALITQVDTFAGEEGKIGLIIGDSGHGKTRCLREYAAANHNTVYIQLDSTMNSTTMFNEIAEKLGVAENGSLAVITRRLIEYLQNKHIIVILDEASRLKINQLDQLRQIIVIKCHCPLILAGNADLLKTIMQPTMRRGHESLDQFISRMMYPLILDNLASDKNGGLYTSEEIRKLYEYGGIRLTTDAVRTLQKICKTPRSCRMHLCDLVIMALHTDKMVNNLGQVDSEYIIAAINELNLPGKNRLPVILKEIEAEEPKTAVRAG